MSLINNNLIEKYKNLIELSLNNANNNISKINDDIINLDGMSGLKTRHFYNNLLNIDDARYLEIGVWKGSSVCSAMYNNNANIICIDNYSQFGYIKEELLNNINKFKGNNNIKIIENDCFNLDISILPKFNIYMYDAGHNEIEQYNALHYYYNCLDDIFIYIVDDWNWEAVRNGTNNAIKDLKLNILYEKEIFTGYNGDKNGWWNGIYIVLLEKTN